MESKRILDLLAEYESRNITFVDPDGSWPIVWEKAKGVHVWDAEGRSYLDLTAAFGVAACGHANPKVVRAAQEQLAKLPHAMGDVHPHAPKALLARELSRITFERWEDLLPNRFPDDAKSSAGKTIFCNSGFEAVEAALKTAFLATRKPGVIAFSRAYHGLGYGALNATHRSHFRAPFQKQLRNFGHFVSFPSAEQGPEALARTEREIKKVFARTPTGAILVEPVQVRGGIHIPDPEFLNMLRGLCSENGALLVLDEIYTGFGRTGRWFACEHSGVVPDLICLGKALTGGFPLSACVGRADIMDAAWPPATGEAIHTSTFLGNPVGCAMALAQIRELYAGKLVKLAARRGTWLIRALKNLACESGGLRITARGIGLLAGLELHTAKGPATDQALAVIKAMLEKGFIMLPEGEFSNVISFSPPLVITEAQLKRAVTMLQRVLRTVASEA